MNKLLVLILSSVAFSFGASPVSPMKISDYPRANTLGTNDLFLIAYNNGTSYNTNKSITFTNFAAQLQSFLSVGSGSGTLFVNGSAITNANFATGGNVTVNVSSVTNVTFDIGSLTDGNLAAGAAISRSKIAAGTANHLVINDSGGNFSSEATLGATRFPALTGDVTTPGGSLATTIANNAVTYAKMQDVSAASKLIGRGDSGSGDPQEITLGTGLTMTGTTISASGGTAVYVAGSSVTNPNFQSDQFAVNANTNVVIKSAAITTNLIRSGRIALTDGATINIDLSLGENFIVSLGGNRTLAVPTNGKDGQLFKVWFVQDSTGNRTISFPTNYVFGTNGVITGMTLTTNALNGDCATFEYFFTNSLVRPIGFVTGYQF